MRHRHAHGFQRLDLLGGGALAAADDGAGVAHALARRGRLAGDEAGDRRLHVLADEFCRRSSSCAADLADHDHMAWCRGRLEHAQHVDELGADDGIAADADDRALADAEFATARRPPRR